MSLTRYDAWLTDGLWPICLCYLDWACLKVIKTLRISSYGRMVCLPIRSARQLSSLTLSAHTSLFFRRSLALIALDFSKAFDTVRHDTLALLNIPDAIYNWLTDSRSRALTKYGTSTSQMLQVSTSIIQGSAIGPVSYDINASECLLLRSV